MVETKGYCTDLFFDQAIRWIGGQKDKNPFFCYIPTNVNHTPKIPPILPDGSEGEIMTKLVNDHLTDVPTTHKPFHDLYREQLGQERYDAAMRAMTWSHERPRKKSR